MGPTADCHFSSDGIRKGAKTEVEANHDNEGKHYNNVLRRRFQWFYLDATDNDESHQHHEVGDHEVDTAAHSVGSNYRGTHGKYLNYVGDELNEKRVAQSNSLNEDNAINVEEQNAADLLAEHSSSGVCQLASFDGIRYQRSL